MAISFPTTPTNGQIFNAPNGVNYSYNSATTSWVAYFNKTSSVRQSFVATAGQTVFTVTGGYTVGSIDVYWEGVKLDTGSFTATDGLTVVLSTAVNSGDDIQVLGLSTFSVANALSLNGGVINGPLNGGPVVIPTGRLTLTSQTPVLSATVSAAGTVYYTPYLGNQIPIWNGSNFVITAFSEMTNILANGAIGSAGPASVVASSVYDLFVWNNGGTYTLTRGPAWTNATTRSLTLTRTNGILVNTTAITNGPAANYGTYVGTIASDSSGATVSWQYGSSASGGGLGALNVWNMYNRKRISTQVRDSTVSWTYASTTIRAADNSSTCRVNFVMGLAEDGINATYIALSLPSASGVSLISGTGVDSTTVASGTSGVGSNSAVTTQSSSEYSGYLLGSHYISAIESCSAATSVTVYGTQTSGGGSSLVFDGWF